MSGTDFPCRMVVALLVLLCGALPAAAQLQQLVGSGVSSVAVGTLQDNDPSFYWASLPDCSNAPGDELRPAVFYRASLAVGAPRAVFSFNPPRPVGTCNPYRLLSDIVTDGTYLYYIDNQGAGGHKALWRRPQLANPGDPSEFLAELVPELTSANLIVFGVSVIAILRVGAFEVIYQYHKDTGALLNGNIEIGTGLSNLQYDGRYLYWINSGALRRNDTFNGNRVTVLNGPIQTYYLEGYDELCSPKGCEIISRVLYSQDNRLYETETVGGGVFPLYTSPVSGARITDISRDATHYYFIERRPVGGGFDREDRFYRLGVSDSVPALIYGPINNGGPGFDSVANDYVWLYFRERVQQTLLRLANDSAAIPVHDLAATRVEINQGLQNIGHGQRLIADKRTIVRFYVRSAIPGDDVRGVGAILSGYNDNGFLGSLEPVNAGGKLITVRTAPQRKNLDHSFQFELPRHWTTGGPLTVSATVNPYGRIVEDNTQNNSASFGPVVINASPRLLVIYYNFSYDLGGTRYTPNFDDVATSRRRMRRLYPLGEPGNAFESPGLHTVVLDFVDNALTTQVDRTDPDCIKRYKKASDRNLCASDYVHGRMAALRKGSGIAADAVSYGNIAQAPAPMGLSYFTRGYANGQFASGPSTDANYASHEVGHTLGRAHPTQGAAMCGHSASDDDYPYTQSLIENGVLPADTRFAGLDFAEKLPGTMTFIDGASYYDTMSYCSPNWISEYTFEGMYAYLISDARPRVVQRARLQAVPGDWLIATGTLDPATGEGGFVIVERTNSVMDASPPVPGGFTLELRNATGGLLNSHGFTANPTEDQPGHYAFDLVVPFVPGTAELRVVEDASGAILARRTVSVSPPLVSDVQLPGAPDPVDGEVAVTWVASDPDGDPLRFDLLASRDGGATFRPILLGLTTTEAQLDTALLGGGTNRLRVVASDGVQTAYAESAPFTVPGRPPTLVVTSPVDGFRADWNQLLSFEVDVTDVQDERIPDAQIVWSGNLSGPLGTGRWLQTDQLPVGENVVEVTATNSTGTSASASVTVLVGDLLDVPGPRLSVAPQSIGWHVAAEDLATQVAVVSVDNGGGDSLQFDVTADAGWVLIDSAHAVEGVTAPHTFTVTAAPSALPEGTTSQATLTFQNRADPEDMVTVPVELARGNVFDHTGEEPLVACTGDCDGDGTVRINELITGVNIALGNATLDACSAFDADADGEVRINELVIGVGNALAGC